MQSKISAAFTWMIVAGLAMGAHQAMAANAGFTAKVQTILYDDEDFGQCMVNPSVNPGTVQGVTCNNNWVSLDCAGNFGSKASGAAKLSAAQLAQVTDSDIYFYLDDTKTYNGGFCVAVRVEL